MLRATQQFVDVLGTGDGKLRATQQFVDVLGSGDAGALRACQQYVMVLVPAPSTFRLELESMLSLSQDVRMIDPHLRLYQTLSLDHKAPAEFRLSADSVLDFSGIATRVYLEDLVDELELFSAEAQLLVPQEHSVFGHTLELTQTLHFEAGLFMLVVSTLALNDSLVFRGPVSRTVRSKLRLNGVIPYQDHFAKVASTLNFLQVAGRFFQEDVSSLLSIVDEVFRTLTPSQFLSLVQSVDFQRIRGLLESLLLNQELDLSIIRARLTEHDMALGHAILMQLRDICDTKAYRPLTSESTIPNQPSPPPETLTEGPGTPAPARVLLAYPETGAACSTVALRAPNMDNKDRQNFTRINRETAGGKLTVFADPTWPKKHTLLLSFTGLKIQDVEELTEFLLVSLGKKIALYDWEGRHWVGIITTPGDQIVEDGPQGFTATFEFQGEQVERPGMGACLSFSQSVNVTVE